jgi:hypothetical protein
MREDTSGFDYMAEADKTNSIVWNPQYVDHAAFVGCLRQFVELANVLDVFKKLLFRGRTPEQMNMRVPDESASLAGNGGHVPAFEIDLVHGILGGATEAGEAAEILLDLLEGKRPDRVNVIEEAGDRLWYINRELRWAGVTFEDAMRINVDKLHGRHGTAFDVFRDANRDLEAERSRLEAGAVPAPADVLPTLPLGPHGDEEPFVRCPIGDCEGMNC